MLRPQKYKRRSETTTWGIVEPTKTPYPPSIINSPIEDSQLCITQETKLTIENCPLNGKIQEGSKICFPQYINQQTNLLSKVGKNIILKNITSKETFEVKLLRLYNKDEWSSLMALGSMDPVFLLRYPLPMDRGCQIAIIKKL